MIAFLSSYQSLADQILIYAILAMSQCLVMRAGLFSLAPTAFAGIGAYTMAILSTAHGVNPMLAIVCGVLLAMLVAAVMAVATSRLRGVFQAVATLALVQVMITVGLGWESVTRGALGINGIPKVATTGWLFLVVAAATWLLWTVGRYSIGRAFDLIREDETVAVSLGISVSRYHRFAMILSGMLGGLAGALYAGNSHAIQPTEFGFSMIVAGLTMAVLGGHKSVWGALLGSAILISLPELFRVFAEYRNVFQGVLLMLVIIFLPNGIVDSLLALAHEHRVRRSMPPADRVQIDTKARAT